jgi:DNA-nicking Smr family endonuclease
MATKKRGPEPLTFSPFKDLKKIIDREKMVVPSSPAVYEKKTTLNDKELFKDAMKGVREIREFREMPMLQKKGYPGWKGSIADRETLSILEEIIQKKRPINLPDTQEYVEWVNQDYQKDIVRKLHEGQYSIQDILDLHGAVVEEAEEVLEEYIKESVRKRYRCIKIIHGRGLRSPKGPVLKEAVISWLTGRYRKNVIAFVTARQCDGGLGALYVLLR